MASGASARTLFSLVIAGITLAVVALPASGDEAGPDCNGLTPTITGSNAGEWIVGTDGDDVIRAGAGDDTITAGAGNDIVCAGPGNDTTRGGQGNDTVRSGRGNDSTSGEGGDDDIVGQGDGDIGDGGAGVDRCFFETHEQCEADLDIDVTGPSTATKGGPGVSVYNAHLVNHGPTPAVNARIDFTLPDGAVFIPAASDSRCTAMSVTQIRCIFGSMGLEIPTDTHIGVNFTGCQDPVSVPIDGKAEDPRTNDHVDPNTTDSITTALTIDPSCLPTAVDDAATVNHDSANNPIDVLANDVPGGAPFSVGSKTNGAHGTVAIGTGGANVTYTPAADFCGSDTFTYSLTPGGSTATVTITVPCPTAVDDTATVDHDSSDNVIDVLANDGKAGNPISVGSKTNGAHGQVVIGSGGANVEYTPDSDFCGQDTFTYSLKQGGSTATVTVTVTCPTAVDDVVSYDCFTNQEIFVLANDINPGGGPFRITSVTQGANGTVSINPGGQSLQYQGGFQNDSFTYTISPGGSTATVTINTNGNTCES